MTIDEFLIAHDMVGQTQLAAYLVGWALALLFGNLLKVLV